MRRYFARSLDRPLEVGGLKGRWLSIFCGAAVASVLVAVVTGVAAGSAAGIVTAAVLVVCSYLACRALQGRVSARQLPRVGPSRSLVGGVRHNETLGRILLPDPRREDGGE